MKKVFAVLLLAMLFAGAGCSVGPDYVRPEVATPAAYDGAMAWGKAVPADNLPKGPWWQLFGDETLNGLEEEAAAHNPEISAALARVEEARATARISKSDFYPHLDFSPSGWLGHGAENSPYYNPLVGQNNSDARLSLDLSYEVDLWGKIRRQTEAAKAGLQASASEAESVKLTLQAEVARNYFLLRTLDTQIDILAETVRIYAKSVELIAERKTQGLDNDFNLMRAQTELAQAKVRAEEVALRRGKVEHSLAILLGKPPTGFVLKHNPLDGGPPVVPSGTPAQLLERRPDVAGAERMVAAANARIGVAQAAFFPSVKILGDAGFESFDAGTLFEGPSRFWSVGPSVTLPIFEAGKNEANLDRNKAAYLESVERYRACVLRAFCEVEDSLLGLHSLRSQYEQQEKSVVSSQQAYDLAQSRYSQGLTNYLDVIDAERMQLNTRQGLAEIRGQRFATTILLIKALGGGWTWTGEKSVASLRGE
jgi:outer membrane protein, multidrug efflux system